MTPSDLRQHLGGGDRRSIGTAAKLAKSLARDPLLFAAAVRLLSDVDPVIRMRAADALEKASREAPQHLSLHREQLLALGADEQQELRWHFFQMIPRIDLSPGERRRVFELAASSIEDPSRIVATEALTAMFNLSANDSELRSRAILAAKSACNHAAASVRARARRLLA